MITDRSTFITTEERRRTTAARAYALLPTESRSRMKWRWRRYVWPTHGRTARA